MKKLIILCLGLSLTAASCNLLGGGSGSKGVLVSEDGGKNFTALNQQAKKGTIGGVSINSFIFDSKNPDTLYIAASSGVYKSTDLGKTWNHILTGIAVADVVSDPNVSDVIYASGLAGRNGKIIKSTDGGGTWTDIYTEPSKSLAVVSVAVSKANSRIILAGLATGEIIRSTDEGKTWQSTTDLTDSILKIRYYNSSTVYVLSLTKGLTKSTDQGATWTQLSGATIPNSGILPGTAGSVTRYLDVAFDQKLSGVMFVSTQQGLLRTIDDGKTWSIMYLPVRDNTLTVTSAGISPIDSNTIYTAVGSTLFKSTNGGVTWETHKLPSGQTVRHILINPNTPNLMYLGMGDKK